MIAQPRTKLQRAEKAFVNKVAWVVKVASPYVQVRCLLIELEVYNVY
jgi:hypothetical protein